MDDEAGPASDASTGDGAGDQGGDQARRDSPGLSSLLQRSILSGAAIATLLFALPLAFAVNGLYKAEATSELARKAEQVRAALTNAVLDDERRIAAVLPPAANSDTTIGVYRATGRLIAGRGPSTAEDLVADVARSGVEAEDVVDGHLLVAVPAAGSHDGGTVVIRVAEPYSHVRRRTYATWALMGGLAASVVAVVAALGRARARRIARPLQSLAEAAESLGHGDFSVRAVHAGVAEVDAASESLERTARRLGGMLERERRFTADASHQMRSPLTAVRLGLESALMTPGTDLRQSVTEALTGLDRLEQTVLDLLALARDTGDLREATDVGALVAAAGRQWARVLEEHERTLEVRCEADLPPAAVSKPALRTVLDVLLTNALSHGAGRVRVTVRATDSTVVVEVCDEGIGVRGDPGLIFARRSADAHGTGIGLALARSLVEADGGRLELTRAVPATFALLMPAAQVTEPAGVRSSGS